MSFCTDCKHKQPSDRIRFVRGLTCVHLIHAVEEVIWSAGDAVAAHTQAAVCALIPGVVGPAENMNTKKSGLGTIANKHHDFHQTGGNKKLLFLSRQSFWATLMTLT